MQYIGFSTSPSNFNTCGYFTRKAWKQDKEKIEVVSFPPPEIEKFLGNHCPQIVAFFDNEQERL